MSKIGKTETEITAENIQTCREIVDSIHKFGVSQDQIKTIIKFLALELEDVGAMKRIVHALKGDTLRLSPIEESNEGENPSTQKKIII